MAVVSLPHLRAIVGALDERPPTGVLALALAAPVIYLVGLLQQLPLATVLGGACALAGTAACALSWGLGHGNRRLALAAMVLAASGAAGVAGMAMLATVLGLLAVGVLGLSESFEVPPLDLDEATLTSPPQPLRQLETSDETTRAA